MVMVVSARSSLLVKGRVLGQPRHIHPGIAGGHIEREVVVIVNRSLDFRTSPLMDLRVTVAERKSAGPVMVTGRKIDDLRGAGLVSAVRFGCKSRVVDAVRVFIYQEESFDGQNNGGILFVNAP